MRYVALDESLAGHYLARPVYNEIGTTLINEGTALTTGMIRRLKQLGVTHLYIIDPRLNDVDWSKGFDVSEETRRRALQTIRNAFIEMASGQHWKKQYLQPHWAQREYKAVFEDLLSELRGNKQGMIMFSHIYMWDHYLYHHSLNVAMLTLAMSVRQGYTKSQLMEIAIGGLLHDIGKTLIPKTVLDKPGRLNKDEFTLVQKHTEYGFEILRKQDFVPLLAAHCAYQHHERLNGTGYPRNLKGDEIHPYGKMMAVADVYDAMTSHRVYRDALLPHEALDIISQGTGHLFDETYVALFRETIAPYPLGMEVCLTTGEKGVVVDINTTLPERPVIRVLYNEADEEVEPYEVDLSKYPEISITHFNRATMYA